jgi:hypothetical protein
MGSSEQNRAMIHHESSFNRRFGPIRGLCLSEVN